MPTQRRFASRQGPLRVSLLLGAFAWWWAAPAHADYAEPAARPSSAPFAQPPSRDFRYHSAGEAGLPVASDSAPSLLRLHVGPALLLEPAGPGLFTALDVGARAVGLRLSGAWFRAESDRGMAVYSSELWIDFANRSRLHPLLGAGAAWLRARAERVGVDENVGAAVLRGAIEYELPVSDADARLGLNLTALLPAIGTERARPWASAALTVGAGF